METKRCNFFPWNNHRLPWFRTGREDGEGGEKPIDHLRRSINRKKKPHRAESTRRHGGCARDAIKLAACATDVVRDERVHKRRKIVGRTSADAREEKNRLVMAYTSVRLLYASLSLIIAGLIDASRNRWTSLKFFCHDGDDYGIDRPV